MCRFFTFWIEAEVPKNIYTNKGKSKCPLKTPISYNVLYIPGFEGNKTPGHCHSIFVYQALVQYPKSKYMVRFSISKNPKNSMFVKIKQSLILDPNTLCASLGLNVDKTPGHIALFTKLAPSVIKLHDLFASLMNVMKLKDSYLSTYLAWT